ncbi:unnamed protein product [Spodoptera exigua]|nr:unnamed protein product [Spodoptera exigua]
MMRRPHRILATKNLLALCFTVWMSNGSAICSLSVRQKCCCIIRMSQESTASFSRGKAKCARYRIYIITLIIIIAYKCPLLSKGLFSYGEDEPGFSAPIANVTAPLGREAILACTVHNLSTYKVAWLRVDTQTILTIHTHVISRSRRVGVTHSDHRTWFLHIRELRETDRGWYMCQINTDPMKSQLGYLDIVVPPDILDRGTSTDQTVREGASINLTCAATGSPHPQITWRREHSKPITISDGMQVTSFEGPELNISRVTRQHAGAYLCIASNGVPPTVSKRIMLTVQFPPVITIRNQLVGAALGTELVLECETEAYPKPVSYWSRDNGEIVPVDLVEVVGLPTAAQCVGGSVSSRTGYRFVRSTKC